jgi:predicted AlkP superfamily phosphohydrolase/phosphomutase
MHTLILGFDAFDPVVFERLSGQGKLPHLTRYAESGGYSRFAVTNPPQSEVSWTSIATGLNPGGHGIFDFVHRDPATYSLSVSLLPTKRGILGTQFVPPFEARTIFDQAARQGYPATVLWWPATFPARPESPVRTLPGLGTPDIQGRLGVGTLFTTDAEQNGEKGKTAVEPLKPRGKNGFAGLLSGPARKTRKTVQQSTVEFELDLLDDRSARLTIDKKNLQIHEGEWSPVLDLSFRVGRFASIRALTRAILSRLQPGIALYFLPLQLHPLHSMWRYASPQGFVKQTWQACGPFLTLGWQQDTTALEEGCITVDQFLSLCESIHHSRECALMHHLQEFDEGVLGAVFDSLDRIQHMFWRDRPEIIEAWYEKLDALLGRVESHLDELGDTQPRIVVVSDHGFAEWDYQVHLNRWLVDQGYLVMQESKSNGSLQEVDWSRSRAYAVGLNSLYVNLKGREGQGCVLGEEYSSLVGALQEELLAWQGPDNRPVVRRALRQAEAFEGPLTEYGPDLVIGYSRGYRASSDTGLGKWGPNSIEPNAGHWGGDHCMDGEVVPGVVLCNHSLKDYPQPSYRDVPALTIGAEPDASGPAPPPSYSHEDEAVIEERLKGLGYL